MCNHGCTKACGDTCDCQCPYFQEHKIALALRKESAAHASPSVASVAGLREVVKSTLNEDRPLSGQGAAKAEIPARSIKGIALNVAPGGQARSIPTQKYVANIRWTARHLSSSQSKDIKVKAKLGPYPSGIATLEHSSPNWFNRSENLQQVLAEDNAEAVEMTPRQHDEVDHELLVAIGDETQHVEEAPNNYISDSNQFVDRFIPVAVDGLVRTKVGSVSTTWNGDAARVQTMVQNRDGRDGVVASQRHTESRRHIHQLANRADEGPVGDLIDLGDATPERTGFVAEPPPASLLDLGEDQDSSN